MRGLCAVFIILCSFFILADGLPAQDAESRNVKLEVILSEGGTKIKPMMERSDKVFLRQFLVIQNGFYGRVFIGKRTGHLDWFKSYLLSEDYISNLYVGKIIDIAASLKTVPHIIGDKIELSVVPALTCVTKEGEETIDLNALTLTLIAPQGGAIDINSNAPDDEFYDYFFKTEAAKSVSVVLIPTVLEYGGTVE